MRQCHPSHLILLGSFLLSTAVPASADDPGPMHRIQLPGNPYITSAAFTPNGETLYVLVPDEAINVWEILVYYWPEIGGAITAIAMLFFMFLLRRVLRTPQIPGEPHCRRCNYCLKEAVEDRCPECFTPTKRTRTGRTSRRRLFPVSCFTALVVLAYATPWALWLPRSGSAGSWFNWWSYEIEAAAAQRGVDLKSWKRPVDRVYEIDVLAGTISRTLMTRVAARSPLFEATPDGRGLLIPIDGDRLALVSTATGAVLRSLNCPVRSTRPSLGWRQIAGFDERGNHAYIVVLDEAGKRTKLLQWNLETSHSSILLDLDADEIGVRKSYRPRRLYRVPSPETRFLELPSGINLDWRFGKESSIRVHSCDAPNMPPLEFTGPVPNFSGPGFSSEGSRVFIESGLAGLASFSLENGMRAEWKAPATLGVAICDSAQSGRMVFPALTGWLGLTRRFLVADLDSKTWLSRLSFPQDLRGMKLFVAPSTRFFAAAGYFDQAGTFQHELLIYDLRHLPKTAVPD